MPRTTTVTKKVTRKRYKPRRRRRRWRKARLPIGGFPTSKMVKLRYCQEFALDPAMPTPLVYRNFRANSLHDPDRTGGGHQPRYRDQWAEIYDHYTVIGSKITVMAFNPSSPGVPGLWGIYLDDNSTNNFTSVMDAIEATRSNGKYRMAGRDTNQTGGFSPRLTHTFSAKKFFNKTVPSMIGDTKYSGSMYPSSNPDEDVDFVIWYGSVNAGDDDPAAMNFIVTIDYVAILSERKTIVQS